MNDPKAPAKADPPAVFISYAREDRRVAGHLAAALQADGLGVWWDREILGGAAFAEVIETELNRADVAIVLWSEDAVRSSFVRDEAARALMDDKLLPVRIAEVAPPLGFGQIHTLDLIGWEGEVDAPLYVELLAHVRRHLKGDASPRSSPPQERRAASRRRKLMVAGGAGAGVAVLGWFGWSRFTRDTERAQELTAQGIDKFEAKLFDPARFLFNQALQADDQYAPALFYRAQVLIQSGASQEAAEDLRRTLKLKLGLDGAQLRDADRWLADLAGHPAEPAPLTRVAVATTEPSPKPGVVPAPPPPASPASPPASIESLRSLPLAEEARAPLEVKVAQMFSANKDARIRATTELIVDAEATSDAVPLALDTALRAEGAGLSGSPRLAGVINVLTLLLSAAPASLSQNAADVRRLLDLAADNGPQTSDLVARVGAALDKADTKLPIVFMQIASDSERALANAVADRLRDRGYQVPDVEVVGNRAPAQTEIRIHGRSDQGLARWMDRSLEAVVGGPVRVQTLAKAQPKVDTYEIWIARGLCEGSGPHPAACG